MRKGKNLGWRIGVAIRVGEAAWKLAVERRVQLDPRLPAGLIDGLGADIVSLREAGAGTKAKRAQKRSATFTQNEAARIGNDLAVAVRGAVRRAAPDDKAFQKAFGVGVVIDPKKVASVEGALETILRGAEADPEAARGVGILPEDLEEVRQVKEALSSADSTQGEKTVSSKVATSDRNALQDRVQNAVRRIVGTAGLAFRGEPAVVKLFAELIPSHAAAAEDDSPAPTEASAPSTSAA